MPERLPRLLAWGLLILGLAALLRAGTATLDQRAAAAVRTAVARVERAMAAGDDARLQHTLDTLLAQHALGFRQLTVRDVSGHPLVSAGDLTSSSWWLSGPAPGSGFSGWVDDLRWRSGSAELTVAARALGRLDYVDDPWVARASSGDGALAALWAVGVACVLLAVGLLWLLYRRVGVVATSMTRRESAKEPPRSVPLRDVPTSPSSGTKPVAGAGADPAIPSARTLLEALTQSGFGVMTVDSGTRVRWLNEVAQGLTGWLLADARGQMAYTVFHLQDDAGETLPQPVETALAMHGTVMQRYSGWLLARGGGRRAVDGSVIAFDAGGSSAHALVWFSEVGARRLAQTALRRRALTAEAVVDELAESVLVTDDTGKVKSANARALRMFGYTREEIAQQTVPRLMPVPFMNAPDVRFTEYRATPSRRLPRAVAWRKDATYFPAELVVEALPAAHGEPGYVVIVRDVTERLRSINLAQRLGRLLDSAVEEVYIFDANSLYFLEVNRGARRNLGYDAEELLRMTPLMISEGLEVDAFQGYLGRLRGGEAEHLIYRTRHRRADGSVYPVEVRLNFSREEEPPVFMAIAADISEREAQEKELSRMAHFDSLTGLPNRPQLVLRMQAAMAMARNGPKRLAVMFMDIDRFKSVNDEYGHEVGDEVLKVFGMRLRESLRTADTVARLSGDEFVVLAEGVRGVEDVEIVLGKLQSTLHEPMAIGALTLELTSSIGVTMFPDDDGDLDALLHHADEAMYEAKRSGPGQYRFYRVES